MRISDSTVNMLSGRNYTQTGMHSGGGYTNGFIGMISANVMKRESSMAKDKYQTGTSENLRLANTPLVRSLNYGSQITLSHNSYSETEETGFHASRRACTEDGWTIDFNINILMSRNYTEYMNVSIPTMADALCYPLVVNIGSDDTADVRDQTFKFDLDADGKEDEISMLRKGSGFLALDKDGNGKIDDGNELFGTKSSDGFSNLREYDSDGSGWSDKNDEIL